MFPKSISEKGCFFLQNAKKCSRGRGGCDMIEEETYKEEIRIDKKSCGK